MVYLPLHKVADTPFHIKGDELLLISVTFRVQRVWSLRLSHSVIFPSPPCSYYRGSLTPDIPLNPLTSRPGCMPGSRYTGVGVQFFRHLKLELLTQFPASNDEKYINVVYIWRKFVSFYGYVHWRMTTEISVMYGSEKGNGHYTQMRRQIEIQCCVHILQITYAELYMLTLTITIFISTPTIIS